MAIATPPVEAPVEHPPIEVVTPIKPSEAIRLGIIKAPVQCFESYSDGPGSACALGAMRLGYGGQIFSYELGDGLRYNVSTNEAAEKAEYTLGQRWFDQPCHLCGQSDVFAWPAHLNDAHTWSRSRIADFLEGLGL